MPKVHYKINKAKIKKKIENIKINAHTKIKKHITKLIKLN